MIIYIFIQTLKIVNMTIQAVRSVIFMLITLLCGWKKHQITFTEQKKKKYIYIYIYIYMYVCIYRHKKL